MKVFLLLISCLVSNVAFAQELLVIPSSIDYFAVREGLCRNAQARVFNNGASSIPRPAFDLSGSAVFTMHLTERSCPVEIPPDGVCRVTVRFCPTWTEDYQATLVVDDDHRVVIRGVGRLSNN